MIHFWPIILHNGRNASRSVFVSWALFLAPPQESLEFGASGAQSVRRLVGNRAALLICWILVARNVDSLCEVDLGVLLEDSGYFWRGDRLKSLLIPAGSGPRYSMVICIAFLPSLWPRRCNVRPHIWPLCHYSWSINSYRLVDPLIAWRFVVLGVGLSNANLICVVEFAFLYD